MGDLGLLLGILHGNPVSDEKPPFCNSNDKGTSKGNQGFLMKLVALVCLNQDGAQVEAEAYHTNIVRDAIAKIKHCDEYRYER